MKGFIAGIPIALLAVAAQAMEQGAVSCLPSTDSIKTPNTETRKTTDHPTSRPSPMPLARLLSVVQTPSMATQSSGDLPATTRDRSLTCP